MRKVKINQISKVGNKYKVFIDSDYKFYFSSLRKATKFQNDVNQYLTDSLFQLNDIYIDLFTLFRRIYFSVENPLFKRTLSENIKQISELIEMALNRSHFESIGSALVMNNINQIYNNLLNGYQTIRTIVSKRSDTSTIYHTENKIKMLTMLFMEFEKFQMDLSKKDIDNIEVKVIKIA